MIGGAADGPGPAAFALGQVAGDQQIRKRKDAGQRRTDIVRKRCERGFESLAL